MLNVTLPPAVVAYGAAFPDYSFPWLQGTMLQVQHVGKRCMFCGRAGMECYEHGEGRICEICANNAMEWFRELEES